MFLEAWRENHAFVSLYFVSFHLYILSKIKWSFMYAELFRGDLKHLFVQTLTSLQRLCQINIWLCQIKHFPFCIYLSLVVHFVALYESCFWKVLLKYKKVNKLICFYYVSQFKFISECLLETFLHCKCTEPGFQ